MKRLLSFGVALFLATIVHANYFHADDLYYHILSDTTVEVTYQAGSSPNNYWGLTSATIPASVVDGGTTYSVTRIGEYAFAKCTTLTSITIPNSVTDIGYSAFYECSGLTSVSIPNSVTKMGDFVFYACSDMATISLSDNMTEIGNHAFYGCSNLTTISIPDGVTSIGNSAFQYCTSLSDITFPNNITNIGGKALDETTWYMDLHDGLIYISSVLYKYKGTMPQHTSIVIKEGTTCIAGYAFEGCENLTSITIPESVKSIGDNAFYYCIGLTSIQIPNSGIRIGDYAFRSCIGLTSITIPENLTAIGKNACDGCTNLSSVVWNAKKCELEKDSDDDSAVYPPFSTIASNITSFSFGDKVEYIPDALCSGMSNLTTITIPENVTTLGGIVFYGCRGLTSIVWNAKNCQYISYYANSPFDSSKNKTTSFIFGKEVESIPYYLCYGMSKLTNVTIPDGVTSIGSNAFTDCSGITSIAIPESVTSIGESAFSGCTGLTSVQWNAKQCNNFSSSPFASAKDNIVSFTFGDNVENIPDRLCDNMSKLTNITIPNGVTRIGSGAFAGCSGIISITIPENVTSIGSTAFVGCVSLTSIVWNAKRCNAEYDGTYTPFYSYYGSGDNPITSFTFGDNVESIPANLCRGLSNLTSVTIPENVTSIGRNAFYNCRRITSVVWNAKSCGGWEGRDYAPFRDARSTITSFTFGDKVDSIPDYLCYEMSKLSSITIPESVTGIGAGAFAVCYNLTSCTLLSETPTTIGNGTFGYDSSMPITVPCGATQAYRDAWGYYYVFNEPAPQYTLNVYPQNYEMGDIYFWRSYSCNNDTAVVYASSYTGFQFARWDDGNTDNPRTIVVTSDTTFVAYYTAEQYTIDVEVNDTERGSVTGSVTADYLAYTTISAEANYGYRFTRWNDDNTDNPRLVQVTGNAVYTAFFEKNIYSVTALSADAEQGSATANTAQAAYKDTITLTASSNVGYRFAQWSDGNTDNPRAIVLTIDTTFTAEFALAHSGQCGDDLYWKYDNHTLTISGTGRMYDYTEENIPWLLLRDTTTAVTLERGITHIGNYAFCGLAKLNKIELPNTLASIGTNVFAGCRKLYDIYSYAIEPPVADNTSFTNYNVYLYVPCDNLRDYQMDVVFGSFKYIQCIEAENTATDGLVSVTPAHNEAVFEWPADGSAATYTLQISKNDEAFCTLVFNANGQLTNIAFSAPARNGEQRNRPAALLTQDGYRFTVTGLNSGTRYAYDLTVKDEEENVLQSYTGTFTTKGENIATDLDNIEDSNPNGDALNDAVGTGTPHKVFRDGQVYILRGDKIYTTTGVEVK